MDEETTEKQNNEMTISAEQAPVEKSIEARDKWRRQQRDKPTKRKGQDDPIHTRNRYGLLGEGMDVDPSPTPSTSQSSSPRRGRTRSPVKPPQYKPNI